MNSSSKNCRFIAVGMIYTAGSTGGETEVTLSEPDLPAYTHFTNNNVSGSAAHHYFSTNATVGTASVARRCRSSSSSKEYAITGTRGEDIAETLSPAPMDDDQAE